MLTPIFSAPFSWLRFRIGMARYKRRYRNFRPTCGDDAVVRGIDDQVAYLTSLLDRGNMEMFLKRLAELTYKLLFGPIWGRALFLPQLDELARRASLIITPKPNSPTVSKLLVHVATEVYTWGGHTRVIEDVAASLPEYRQALIVTSMSEGHSELVSVKPRLNKLDLKVHLLKTLGWTKKASELSSLIAALSPQAILLLASPHDSVAYVAISGFSAPRVLFLHQSDHLPSLGACRIDYTHTDLTPACHSVCASNPRLRASMLNLTVRDSGTVQLVDRRPILGVTCGSSYKYAGSTEFSYAQLLAALFSAGAGQIFHVGNMPEEQKNQIRTEIGANGQDESQIAFLPNTPSLTAKLLEISPDFYLVSHPVGSGKATLEAMSVGLPILHARPASALPLLDVDMTFGTSVTVSTLQQIPAAVRRLETEKKALAKGSREVYEKHYSPASFREGLLSALGNDR